MRFYIDECLSPKYAVALSLLGHDAVHPLHSGRLGYQDHTIVSDAIQADRVIVTENIIDFRKLLAREDIHPGLIALPQTSFQKGLSLILSAVARLELAGDDPMNTMVNCSVEFDLGGLPVILPLIATAADMKNKRHRKAAEK